MNTSERTWSRLALAGALLAALALAGCGRKGPLDPPPSAAAAQADEVSKADAAAAANPNVPPVANGPARPGSRRPLPIDAILN